MSTVSTTHYNILIDEDYAILKSFLNQQKASKIFLIVDENTQANCLPLLKKKIQFNFSCIQIAAGESFKNIKTCTQVWNALLQNGCDRQSIVINLGGGVIGDMGGFIASTYMRGIRFIQMPTTLLSQVDASIGGKLGIDFLHHKNMIGMFNNPQMVWIDTAFLESLSVRQLRSGYAEIIKHALIHSSEYWNKLIAIEDWQEHNWSEIVEESILIKNDIVEQDPFEKGLRKILNFGHTIGHAVESHLLEESNALTHGEAVAVGMICESYLSYHQGHLKAEELKHICQYLMSVYDIELDLTQHAEALITYMQKDKKNVQDQILFSTVPAIGQCLFDQKFEKSDILKSFEYYQNMQLTHGK